MAKKEGIEFNIFDEIQKALEKQGKAILKETNKAVQESAEFVADELIKNTPVKSEETKKSWVRTTKYNNVAYIYNTQLNKKGIPVVNLLEFSKKGKPFVRKTFENAVPRIQQIFNKYLEKGE